MDAAYKSKSTPVADDWNWNTRIRNELGANKAWQRNWGFLLEHPSGPQPPQLPGGPGKGHGASQDALAAFMQNASQAGSSPVPLSYIAAKQRDSARARRQMQNDSLDGFVSNYMAKASPMARELPTKEFRKPLTTSHEYGWGRNLEVFGKLTILLK